MTRKQKAYNFDQDHLAAAICLHVLRREQTDVLGVQLSRKYFQRFGSTENCIRNTLQRLVQAGMLLRVSNNHKNNHKNNHSKSPHRKTTYYRTTTAFAELLGVPNNHSKEPQKEPQKEPYYKTTPIRGSSFIDISESGEGKVLQDIRQDFGEDVAENTQALFYS